MPDKKPNKVIYGNETLIDLTNDTVTEDSLLEGYTAHNRAGEQITGTASLANAYLTTDTAEETLSDGDYFPFYDTSASAKRKTLWSNIKAVLGKIFAHQMDIAPIEDDTTLSQNYAIGKQFYRQGVLYKAKTALTQGTAWSSLTLNTDYEVSEDITTQIGKLEDLQIAEYDSTDESIVFRSSDVATYDSSDESIIINI